MGLTRKHIATALVIGGGALAIAGVALVYAPAAVILAGLGLAAFGLLGIEVEKP